MNYIISILPYLAVIFTLIILTVFMTVAIKKQLSDDLLNKKP